MNHWSVSRRALMIKVVYISIIFLYVSACSVQPAQVSDRPQPPTRKIQQHQVSAGETLYSIAWSYDLDHRVLANYNGILPPFTIYSGQILQLNPGTSSTSRRLQSASNRPNSPTVGAPGIAQKPSIVPKSKQADRTKNKALQTSSDQPDDFPSGPPNWRWPAKGQVIAGFEANSGLNQGIDIRGNLGEPVEAAADGRVVYAGSGLRGYGNLVIIKHNDTYLSAYAHNRSLKVAEGEKVKAGQIIAEIGRSGSDQSKLHFEIRRDGKPVNPMGYLPKR